MAKFTVKFYKGNYSIRQRSANADRCVLYVEHHFNSVASPAADYTCVVVGSNASTKSRNIGATYAKKVAGAFGVKIGGASGLLVGGYDGRGDGNIRSTNMPAVLLEPLFVSNPKQAEIVRSETGRQQLAEILADTIKHFFPDGGLIGFSVGHKYKTSHPDDRGAPVHGGGTEADFAEDVLIRAEKLLKIQ